MKIHKYIYVKIKELRSKIITFIVIAIENIYFQETPGVIKNSYISRRPWVLKLLTTTYIE